MGATTTSTTFIFRKIENVRGLASSCRSQCQGCTDVLVHFATYFPYVLFERFVVSDTDALLATDAMMTWRVGWIPFFYGTVLSRKTVCCGTGIFTALNTHSKTILDYTSPTASGVELSSTRLIAFIDLASLLCSTDKHTRRIKSKVSRQKI